MARYGAYFTASMLVDLDTERTLMDEGTSEEYARCFYKNIHGDASCRERRYAMTQRELWIRNDFVVMHGWVISAR